MPTSPLNENPDLTTFDILIDGTMIPDTIQLTSILVMKEVNKIAAAKIILIDGSPATENFEVSEQATFLPGNEIEIKAGYHSRNDTIFKGIITNHSIKIRPNGVSFLSIECKDKSTKMTIGRKSNYFYESKDSDVFEALINPYGLASEISDTETTHAELVQFRTTDWDFMLTRAEANGKICLCDDGELKIIDPDLSQSPEFVLTYGLDILSFSAEMDARDQYKSVEASAWNYADQEVVNIESNDPAFSEAGNISSDELSEVINLDKYKLEHGGTVNESSLQAWADAQLLRNKMAKIRGHVKFQGNAKVKPGDLIELAGVGNRFNGNVFVSGVRHQIAEGNWETDIQFGFDPEWFSEKYKISQLPASGLFAAINGLQIGLVTQLQDDPDGEDRILVRLPMIDATEQGIWARVASLDAGNNRGAFFRPEIGDEVILGFINDDPGAAVVLGMLNSSANPAPIRAADDNHEKGFITRSELKVLFDDDKKSILIETPNGNKISISEDEQTISILDENENKVILDTEGITIESNKDISIKASSGDVTIEGQNINLKAPSGDITIEGLNVNAKAGAQLVAEGGASAEISSSGITVVNGSMVQIN